MVGTTFKVLAVTFAAVALMGASYIRKGAPMYAEEPHCRGRPGRPVSPPFG